MNWQPLLNGFRAHLLLEQGIVGAYDRGLPPRCGQAGGLYPDCRPRMRAGSPGRRFLAPVFPVYARIGSWRAFSGPLVIGGQDVLQIPGHGKPRFRQPDRPPGRPEVASRNSDRPLLFRGPADDRIDRPEYRPRAARPGHSGNPLCQRVAGKRIVRPPAEPFVPGRWLHQSHRQRG